MECCKSCCLQPFVSKNHKKVSSRSWLPNYTAFWNFIDLLWIFVFPFVQEVNGLVGGHCSLTQWSSKLSTSITFENIFNQIESFNQNMWCVKFQNEEYIWLPMAISHFFPCNSVPHKNPTSKVVRWRGAVSTSDYWEGIQKTYLMTGLTLWYTSISNLFFSFSYSFEISNQILFHSYFN